MLKLPVLYNNPNALSILFIGLTIAIFPEQCTGISCYDCEVRGDASRYCGQEGSSGFLESVDDVDYRKIPAPHCDSNPSNYCHTTITTYGYVSATVGCLPNYELECIRKNFPTQPCYTLNKETLGTVGKCIIDTGHEPRFPKYRHDNETWGKSCICNTSFCNRDPKTIQTSQTNKNCYVCDDEAGCLTPNVTACPMGYCETQFSGSTGETVQYRGCVKTELWGACAMEFVNETGGGCYNDRPAVSALCWEKYGFDPNDDIINTRTQQGGESTKTCVCNQTLCNNEGLGLTPPTTEPIEPSHPNTIKNSEVSQSTRNTYPFPFLQNIGIMLNFCFFLDKHVIKHF